MPSFSVHFFTFLVVVSARLKEQDKHFCHTSLQASVYAGSLLQNDILMKKFLLLTDPPLFSFIPSICNVKSSISPWRCLISFCLSSWSYAELCLGHDSSLWIISHPPYPGRALPSHLLTTFIEGTRRLVLHRVLHVVKTWDSPGYPSCTN